ncbi:unnamed protein product [Prorocentrum cordatum]|uniref:Uncharacterized protein n=1 Tax=Prorocentrum cordatum TaxID=2364126 RepID=A0ABN9XGE0_9DINO|nr:unnamed protein product [Polarella glacialis]
MGDDPEWVLVAEGQGIAFSEPAASAPEGLVPPWLEAAVEGGIVFYDPDGNEVVVPSDQVGAFQQGLESVREFEHSLASQDAASGQVITVPDSAQRPRTPEARPGAAPAANGCASRAGCAPAAVAASAEEEAARQNLKFAVQKRYFALLRCGVDPNEAAVRAVLEAKNASCGTTAAARPRRQEESPEPRAPPDATREGGPGESSSWGSSSANSRRSCASQQRQSAQPQQGRRKDVSVAA